MRVKGNVEEAIHWHGGEAERSAEGFRISARLGGVEVAADVIMSFNGRPSVQFTDPSVNLVALPEDTPARQWLMPEPA